MKFIYAIVFLDFAVYLLFLGVYTAFGLEFDSPELAVSSLLVFCLVGVMTYINPQTTTGCHGDRFSCEDHL